VNEWLTPEYCDRHYNFMPPEATGQLLSALDARSAKARAGLRGELGVRYGRDADETMDVFHPAGRSKALLIFIHGGYWLFGDKSQFSFPAAAYTAAGVTFIAINYSLAPAVTIEEQVAQCRRAVAHVHEHAEELRTDRDRVYISGHSSGAQLAAMVMETDWPAWQRGLPRELIKGGLALSGVYDLEAIRRTEFLNAVLKLDADRAAALSPACRAPAAGVPLYAAVGALENEEFRRQTRALCAAWKPVLRRELVLPDDDHFTILDSFADHGSPLFAAALEMMAMNPGAR
jgi:arylformamidase